LRFGDCLPIVIVLIIKTTIYDTIVAFTTVASVATSTYGVMSCYELLFSSDVHWRFCYSLLCNKPFFNLLTELIMTGQSHTKDKLSVLSSNK